MWVSKYFCLKTIETKTQNIIQIMDEQAIKMAKLYSDEAEEQKGFKAKNRDIFPDFGYGSWIGLLTV